LALPFGPAGIPDTLQLAVPADSGVGTSAQEGVVLKAPSFE
jgi:hypothetical protein